MSEVGYNRLKVLLALVIVVQVVAIAGIACTRSASGGTANDQLSDAPTEHLEVADQAPVPVSFTVTFAGDCTLGTDEAFDRSTSFNAKFSSVGDPAWFLANVEPIFAEDDLTIVNMEGTLTDVTTRQDKTFAFKGDADYAKVFSTSSVEAASMANNHSKDYGDQSYTDTIAAVEEVGVQTFGYDRIAYRDVKGVKVALIGAYELAEHEGIEAEVTARIVEAKDAGAQVVLVYYHWGIEREYVPNATQVKLAHAAIDAGADLVVGSHPHVIQGWEVYNGRYIVYSLGNFCFGGNSGPSDMDCMIFQQTFTVTGDEVAQNNDVAFIACSISSASGYNNYQPTPASGSEKERIDAKIQQSTDAIAAMNA
ncbi:CapA family protein [Adlercreutzia murintestinalis]|uniref:CapA family protein n=1 Tax=Adlercreutzia murintestinalis TaxID=2941325 RepID=UPI0020416D94|nr:CapA family protein [Adlercreutzia murintestinalis]